jgi:hypothetical protein
VKKLLALVVLALMVFAVLNKQRLYVRDPLAQVTRNGEPQSDVRIMVSWRRDVLMEDLRGGHHRIYLLQNWNKTPAMPMELTCLTGLVCMTDADQATTLPITIKKSGRPITAMNVAMSPAAVQFADEDGKVVEIALH